MRQRKSTYESVDNKVKGCIHCNQLPKDEQAQLKARLGVIILTLEDVDVKKVDTMESVSRDGKTMGKCITILYSKSV